MDVNRINDERHASFYLGKNKGSYCTDYPQEEFETEEEAIKEAYERSEYGTYIIVTQIKFDNF